MSEAKEKKRLLAQHLNQLTSQIVSTQKKVPILIKTLANFYTPEELNIPTDKLLASANKILNERRMSNDELL